MIVITIEMDVHPDKTKELLQTLLLIRERIRMEYGCLSCDFLKNVGYENRYRFIAKWKRRGDFDHHLQSEEFSVLRGAMSLLRKRPEVHMEVVSSSKGMELLHTTAGVQKRGTARR